MCDRKRRGFLQTSAAVLGGTLLGSRHGSAQASGGSALMAETARRLPAALTPEQLAKAQMNFSDDERRNWHYVPLER